MRIARAHATRPVLLEKSGRIARIVLNRPGASNAIDAAMAAELREACRAILEDEAVAVVVLTGAGKVFCAEGKRRSAPTLRRDADDRAMEELRVAEAIAAIPVPTVAGLNGDALGHGLEVALACDLRVAVEGARLGLGHVAAGAIPWDGGTQRLPRLAPRGIALEMILTGRQLDAAEAQRWGLVTQVFPHGEFASQVEALAGRLAEAAPVAARYAKEAVRKGMDVPLEHGLRLEADLAVLLHTTSDRGEGIGSFLERRRPKFTGR